MNTKSKTLTVVQQDSVKFFVNAGITAGGINFSKTDLIVLTTFEDTKLGEGPSLLDLEVGGAISQAIAGQGFTGALGEQMLIDLTSLAGRFNHALVLGLGNSQTLGQSVLCASYQRILDTAKAIGAKRLTILVFPNRLTSASMNLEGQLAVLACRIIQTQSTSSGIQTLAEVEVVCTTQAKRYIVSGLTDPCQLCRRCAHPQLPNSKTPCS